MTARNAARLTGDETGFTVIELLVVVVVIPLLIGAIASAMVVSFNTESHNSNRISDSLNVQLTQDYFVRDTLGAAYITTTDNSTSGGPYSLTSPQVCSPGAGSLLVALYRPASGGGSPLDVSYWLENTGAQAEVDRYACTLGAGDTSGTPVKTLMATIPPTLPFGSTQETITASADIEPVQFAGAAGLGWTSVGAFTIASGISGTTLNVGSPAGFTLGVTSSGAPCVPSPTLLSASGCTGGTITVETTGGPQEMACTGFTFPSSSQGAEFTGCSWSSSPPNYPVAVNSIVTQANVSAVQLSISEPASKYHYSLTGAPRTITGQLASAGASSPTLLTLGTNGIDPGHGGGAHACPDGVRANICIGDTGGPSVVVDSGGTVICTGGGVHDYIHFQNNAGTVETVAAASSSSCHSVAIAPTLGVPDPLDGLLPNGGCLLKSYVDPLASPSKINPSSTYDSAYRAPGVWTSPLSGTLEPGLYIIEAGIGSITGMAPYSASDPYYSGDQTAGVLLYVPPTSTSAYPAAQDCYVSGSGSTPTLGGSVSGLAPIDAMQSEAYYGLQGSQPSASLAGVWLWQDKTNAASISTTGYTDGGLLYAPGAQISFSGHGTISTGSMIVSGVNWNGTDGICLNWQSSGSWNVC